MIIPLDDLKDGAHIRGKTIAELGYGNTPADLITYTKTEQGKTEDFLLLVNFERGSSIIPVAQLEAASARPGIETIVPFGQIVGLEVVPALLSAPCASTTWTRSRSSSCAAGSRRTPFSLSPSVRNSAFG